MQKLYSRKCDRCGKNYIGRGKQFCSKKCINHSLLSVNQRFWSKVNITELFDCWNWTGHKNKDGYGIFAINNKPQLAHRVAWELTYGKIPEGMCVCHTCDNPSCCNPAHLFLGSHQDNIADMIKKNRHSSKLTKEDIIEIRQSSEKGIVIAKKFNVTTSSISLIRNRKHWKYI